MPRWTLRFSTSSTASRRRCAGASTPSSSLLPWTRSGSASSCSTGTSRTRSRGSSRRTPPPPSGSTRCSTRWPRAFVWSRCCCTRSSRDRRSGCSPRSAARTCPWTTHAWGRSLAAPRSPRSGSSFRGWSPGSARRLDGRRRGRHALSPGPLRSARRRVDRTGQSGGAEPARHGRDQQRCDRARIAGGGGSRRRVRDRGPPPARDRRLRRRRSRGDRADGGQPERVRDRRDRPRLLPRSRTAGGPASRLRRAAGAGAATRTAGRDPHARRGGRHLRHPPRARRHAARRDPALLLRPRAPRRVRRARLPLLLRGERDLPEGNRPPGRGRRGPGRAAAHGDGRPVAGATAGSREAQRTRQCRAHRPAAGRASRDLLRGARAHDRGERRARVQMVTDQPRQADEPRQASLRRLRRYGIRPNRELGQNFLIDDNILGVIDRAAELGPDDVVLEVGGGLGVLSEYLAARVAHLHVVEVDRSLEPPLAEALAPFGNATLHLADAVSLDLAALDPAPGKVVANLPYGVAATVILRTVAELPAVTTWVAMVQREVGERFAAGPGSKAFGATSVLAQLACEVRVLRRIPRTVFHPEPNVESALVLMRRRAAAPPPELTALVHGSFAHRRKALAGSLALVPGASDGLRDAARSALTALGQPADARAERIPAADWPRLADAIGRERLVGLRPR